MPSKQERTASAATVAAFGQLSDLMKDHIYVLPLGHVFTTPYLAVAATVRPFVSISLTARRKSFYLRVGKTAGNFQAAVIAPGYRRAIKVQNARYLCIRLNPLHPLFRAFRPLARTGLLPLDRCLFDHLDDRLDAAYQGLLDIGAVQALQDDVARIAAAFLPEPKPMDTRVERVIELLGEEGSRSLEELSEMVGLSYHRMSHLFADTVGIPIRSYCLWLKLHKVGQLCNTDMPLTPVIHDAGFTDSSHFGRTFQELFGASLSYFLRSDGVRFIRGQ